MDFGIDHHQPDTNDNNNINNINTSNDEYVHELLRNMTLRPPTNKPWYTCEPELFPQRRSKIKKKLKEAQKIKEQQRQQEEEENQELKGPKSWAIIARGKEEVSGQPIIIPEEAADEPPPSTITTTSPLAITPTASIIPSLKPLSQVLIDLEHDSEIVTKLMTTSHRRVQPRGLINSGNICFMNSILQVLVYCQPFYNLIKLISSKMIYKMKSENPLLDGLIEFLAEFERTASTDDENENENEKVIKIMSPDSFYSIISSHSKFKHFQRGRQEDAEEFLGYLLEALHEEFYKAFSSESTPAVHHSSGSSGGGGSANGGEWVEVSKKKSQTRYSDDSSKSLITRIFGGRFKSILEIPSQKNFSSITYDPFQHVQLDLHHDNITDIQQAFVTMSQREQILYKLNPPKSNVVEATKQVLFDELPHILIIHLKRFTYNDTNQVEKITKPISYPQVLTIPDECLNPAKHITSKKYSLFAVVYHHGPAATAGHYTVDVKTEEKAWTTIDDIELKNHEEKYDVEENLNSMELNGKSEYNKTAYLLFYQAIP